LKIVVLGGAGKVAPGANVFLNEQKDVEELIIADYNLEAAKKVAGTLGEKAKAEFADFNDHQNLLNVFKDADAILNSTVYYSNLKVMKACLEVGSHYVDLGGLFYMAQKQAKLDKDFRKEDLTAIIGMGSAPGIVNVMARYACERLDSVDYIHIRDGIVNFTKTTAPIRAPYSVDTLLDEFTMNAKRFQNGEWVDVPPFSEGELVDYPGPVGPQMSYDTLHTEVWTLPISFRDKGVKEVSFKLGLPKDFEEKFRFLVALGFGQKEPIKVGDVEISPREFLKALLDRFPQENVKPDDHKVLRVDVGGQKDGEELKYRLQSVIHPSKRFPLSCQELSVGGPGGMAAWLVARGDIQERGVLPPERCIQPEPFFKLLREWEMPVEVQITRKL